METVGLRYFNVFGPRQDPEGAYAAVIPKWIAAMIAGDEVRINGTGDISRDFCHVKNVVQANLLAATVETNEAFNQAYNIAVGHRTTLDELFELLRDRLAARHPRLAGAKPVYGPFRSGDVMHSLADIGKARRLLGYEPTHSIEQGLDEALDWYERNLTVAARRRPADAGYAVPGRRRSQQGREVTMSQQPPWGRGPVIDVGGRGFRFPAAPKLPFGAWKGILAAARGRCPPLHDLLPGRARGGGRRPALRRLRADERPGAAPEAALRDRDGHQGAGAAPAQDGVRLPHDARRRRDRSSRRPRRRRRSRSC